MASGTKFVQFADSNAVYFWPASLLLAMPTLQGTVHCGINKPVHDTEDQELNWAIDVLINCFSNLWVAELLRTALNHGHQG